MEGSFVTGHGYSVHQTAVRDSKGAIAEWQTPEVRVMEFVMPQKQQELFEVNLGVKWFGRRCIRAREQNNLFQQAHANDLFLKSQVEMSDVGSFMLPTK
jgi:hypothetical protein